MIQTAAVRKRDMLMMDGKIVGIRKPTVRTPRNNKDITDPSAVELMNKPVKTERTFSKFSQPQTRTLYASTMPWLPVSLLAASLRGVAPAKVLDKRQFMLPAFNPTFYLSTYADLTKAFGPTNYKAAMTHWRTHGIGEGRMGSFAFDPKYYRSQIGARNHLDAVMHYINHGINEGIRSSPYFDAKYYLGRYPDLQKAFGPRNWRAATMHWLTYGIREGRQGAPDCNIRDIVNRGHRNLKVLIQKDYTLVWFLHAAGKLNSPKMRNRGFVEKLYRRYNRGDKTVVSSALVVGGVLALEALGMLLVGYFAGKAIDGAVDYARNHKEEIKQGMRDLERGGFGDPHMRRDPPSGGGGSGGGGRGGRRGGVKRGGGVQR